MAEVQNDHGKQTNKAGKTIAALGEIMLRLSTPGHERFMQADSFDVCYGGSEANTLVSLSDFGYETLFLSAVPDNPIGDSAVAALRKYAVGTQAVIRKGQRLGIYFLESGSAVRPSNVVYDRAGSAMAEAAPGDFDFDALFRDNAVCWFHFSGITPALSDAAAALTKEALHAAKRAGIRTSVDLNYRKKLWSREKAQAVMSDLMQDVDVCFGNEEDVATVFGLRASKTDVQKGTLDLNGYETVFRALSERFSLSMVASSLRESHSASHNGWSACLYDAKADAFYHSRSYTALPIVDRVGAGDAFSAGCICGLLDGKSPEEALEFGAAASALKHTMPGDFNIVTRREVETLCGGDASGRIMR